MRTRQKGEEKKARTNRPPICERKLEDKQPGNNVVVIWMHLQLVEKNDKGKLTL